MMETVEIIKEEEQKTEKGLAPLMRQLGGFLLAGSATVFLLQRWDTLQHIDRYLSFLGFTTVITVLGFLFGAKFKDPRSARTLLGVVALIVPVHFAQLGGLIFSTMPLSMRGVHNYPSYLVWQAPDTFQALLVTALGVGLLIPITYTTLSVFARSFARQLTPILLGGGALLLIPLRDPFMIASIASIAFLALSLYDRNYLAGKAPLQTFEGKSIRLLLFASPLLMVVRTFYLYNPGVAFYGVLFGLIAILTFVQGPRYTKSKASKGQIELVSLLPGTLSLFLLSIEAIDIFNVPNELTLLTLSIPIALLFGVVAIIGRIGRYPLQVISETIAILSVFFTLIVFSKSLSFPALVIVSFASLMISVVTILLGAYQKESLHKWIGGFALLNTVLHFHSMAVEYTVYSPWMTLAAAGIVIISSATYFEKKGLPPIFLGKKEEGEH